MILHVYELLGFRFLGIRLKRQWSMKLAQTIDAVIFHSMRYDAGFVYSIWQLKLEKPRIYLKL